MDVLLRARTLKQAGSMLLKTILKQNIIWNTDRALPNEMKTGRCSKLDQHIHC